ncbi:MAG: phage tail protein [Desulfitobacteriaceae bacterium]|nr:phage tail protein [Desulfitobacteriaceae bacterium]
MKKVLKVLTTWGVPVAYLNPPADGLHNVRVELNLNGPWVLTGVLPYQSEKWDYFTDAHIIEIDGLRFRLVSTEEQRDEKGRLLANFRAEGLWAIELGYLYGPTKSVEVLSATAQEALAAVLSGTGWAVGAVTIPSNEIHDLETEKDSVVQNLQKIRELWGGDLVFDTTNRTVSLYAEGDYGADTGMQFRYRKNNRSIKREIKWLPVNRLYVYGKDDLSIASVNAGLEYIEDFTYTRQALGIGPDDPIPQAAIREGKAVNQDIDDPAELLAWGQKQLADMREPRASYTVSVVDLRTLAGYEHETFSLGDWVTVIDEDLKINVKARIVRYIYDPFGGHYPGIAPVAEVTLANFEDNIHQMLADLARVAQTVKESILKNRILRRIALDGLINTAAVQILSGNTKLSWGTDGITAQEVDGQGNPTGRLLRITGQGIAISQDGGQNWSLAITPDGLLGSWVVVNELYAISTADGLSKLTAEGLLTFDRSMIERLRAGRWLEGQEEHFGLRVKAQDGQTVLLDDRGLLQTWQEGRADNVDSTHPLVLNIYIPPETRAIRRALLRFRLQAFRAYETGAASGGGSTVTSVSGGGISTSTQSGGGSYQSSEDDVWHLYGNEIPDIMTWEGSHDHGDTDSVGNHNHGIPDGTALMKADGGTVWFAASGGHYHGISYDGGHAHNLDARHYHHVDIPSHSHNFSVPSHVHDVNIPNHSHGIVFGIYIGSSPSAITVKINGVDRTPSLGGPFNTDQSNLNIKDYLVFGQWNTIELGSSSLGRIDASIFLQVLLGV